MSEPLKLRAVDDDDLAVLAACLQDALVPADDMCFLAEENRFVLVANRFRWESLPPGALDPTAETAPEGPFERVHCGITIENVTRVQSRGFTPGVAGDGDTLLEVLTILAEEGAEGGQVVTLVFAGGAAVRLEVTKLDVILGDVGEPWPTLWRPRHALDIGPE